MTSSVKSIQRPGAPTTGAPPLNPSQRTIRREALPPPSKAWLDKPDLVKYVLSFFNAPEKKRCALVSRQFNALSNDSLDLQLKGKESHAQESYTYQELEDCQNARGLKSVEELLQQFPEMASKIKRLDCSRDWSLRRQELFALLKRLPNLQALWMPAKASPMIPTDEDLTELIKLCPHLTSFGMYGSAFTDKGVKMLLASYPRLSSLHLGANDTITDSSVKEIAQLPHLTSFGISHNPHITNEALMTLAESPHLSSLSLKGCEQVTDETVIALVTKRPFVHLDLSYCTQITRRAVMAIGAHCRSNLEYLDLRATKYESDYMICDLNAADGNKAPFALLRKLVYGCPSLKTVLTLNFYLKETTHTPVSALRKLYVGLLKDDPVDKLTPLLAQIDPTLLQSIYSKFATDDYQMKSVFSRFTTTIPTLKFLLSNPCFDNLYRKDKKAWAKEHFFEQDLCMAALLSLEKTVSERFNNLTEAQQTAIYSKLESFYCESSYRTALLSSQKLVATKDFLEDNIVFFAELLFPHTIMTLEESIGKVEDLLKQEQTLPLAKREQKQKLFNEMRETIAALPRTPELTLFLKQEIRDAGLTLKQWKDFLHPQPNVPLARAVQNIELSFRVTLNALRRYERGHIRPPT